MIAVLTVLLLVFIPAHCLSTPPQATVDVDSCFMQGKKFLDDGHLHDAKIVWEKILSDPVYGGPAYILAARAELKKGNTAAAEATLDKASKEIQNGPYAQAIREMHLELLCKRNCAEAVPLIEKMISTRSEKGKISLTLRLADLQRNLGDYKNAAKHYQWLYLQHPASLEGLRAADSLYKMALEGKISKLSFSESDQLSRATRLYNKGRFDLAADVYQSLLKTKPEDNAMLLKLARCRYKGRQNEKAIALLNELIKKKISDEDRMEVLYLLSLLHWRLDKDKEFQTYSKNLVDKGNTKLRRKALFNLGAHSFEKGAYAEADQYFKKLLDTNPEISTKVDVNWKRAWIKYWNGKYAEAADTFRETRQMSSGERIESASKYWQARALMQADKWNDAEPLFKELVKANPIDYYAHEAEAILKAKGSSFEKNSASNFPDAGISPALASDKHIMAAMKLMDCGLYEFALMQLQMLPKATRSLQSVSLLTARAAYGAGKYHEARQILITAFGAIAYNPPDDAPAEFTEIAFPRIHFSHTMKHAEKHSVDPHLVWAIIRQESAYDPDSVSPAGALGLMQVTPGAIGLTRVHGKIPAKSIQDVLEPDQNIAYGISILAKNLKKFKGSLVPAVASYNADENKVRSWLRKRGKMKQDEFIDNIPYLETRMYVKKVLAGYKAYSSLHRKKDLSGLW